LLVTLQNKKKCVSILVRGKRHSSRIPRTVLLLIQSFFNAHRGYIPQRQSGRWREFRLPPQTKPAVTSEILLFT